MARRRFEKPTPFKEGHFWRLFVWDTNVTGSRKRQRIKLAKADMAIREVHKIAEEKLRQRRALEQLSVFAGGGEQSATLQIAAAHSDASKRDDELRSNSRSKTFQIQ